MKLHARIANGFAAHAAALAIALAALLPAAPARAQSPELQGILDEVLREMKLDIATLEACDVTTFDVFRQALNRAGLENKAAGPVVIGALENACKGAIDLVGGGIITNTYSLARCVYDYYVTAKDTRGLLSCLGVEVAGIGAGKLFDLLETDAATGALTGRVIDRIGDHLKDGGVDDLAAAAKERDIRAFARSLREALEQVEQQAQETQESEAPEGRTFSRLAYGCNVQIGVVFHKSKPPTRQGNSVAVIVSIRDCDCSATPPNMGRMIEEGSVYFRVPVNFREGPGRKPAWEPNTSLMRTVISSKCCHGPRTRTGIGPTPSDGTGVAGPPTGGPPPKPPTDGPPPPPAEPPKPPPTFAELCPECVPIQNAIEDDRYDIDRAEGRLGALDAEWQRIREEQSDANAVIDRARRSIEIAARGMRPSSASIPGGDSRTTRVTPDGVKETVVTGPDGKVRERREERTGNREIDEAHARIVEAQRKLARLEEQAARVRAERERELNGRAAAQARLRADEARLRECEEQCRRRRLGGVEPRVEGVIGGSGNNPFNPDDPLGPPVRPPAGAAGALQFSSASYAGVEGGAALVTVARAGGARGGVSVQYATGGGSAVAGADYAPASGTLSWGDGDAAPKSFSVALVDDTLVEGPETFDVTLSNPGGGASLGSPARATVTIADNDSPVPPQPAGTLQFSSSAYSATESEGSVVITVTRSGGTAGAVAASYLTVAGSASPGSDYQPVSGVLTWANGDAAPKSFSIPLVDDTVAEPMETFVVQLSAPTGGATLGAPSTATVSIADNDVATGPCGAAGNAWQPNAGTYSCGGSCSPSPSPQTLSVSGDRVTISPFHGGGPATFTGCAASLGSDSATLVYFGQANHRATITRGGDRSYSASIVSSGGGTCSFSCSR